MVTTSKDTRKPTVAAFLSESGNGVRERKVEERLACMSFSNYLLGCVPCHNILFYLFKLCLVLETDRSCLLFDFDSREERKGTFMNELVV